MKMRMRRPQSGNIPARTDKQAAPATAGGGQTALSGLGQGPTGVSDICIAVRPARSELQWGTVAVFSGMALSACTSIADPAGRPDLGSSVASVQISGVVDRGNASGRHYFELYGDFPGGTYGAMVYCNGAQVTSRREYASHTQVNLSIEEMPSNTSCSFTLFGSLYTIAAVQARGVSDGRYYFELYGSFSDTNQDNPQYALMNAVCDGTLYPARIEYQSPEQVNISVDMPSPAAICEFPLNGDTRYGSFGPQPLLPPDVEISGVNDRGDTAGERYFELYGKFPASSLAIESLCDGAAVATRITGASPGQVNVALRGFPSGNDWSCGFTASVTINGLMRRSPPFHKQGVAAHAAMPSFVGAYYWGGRYLTASDTPLATATATLRASGFQTARFILSPRVRGERIANTSASLPYGINIDAFDAACPPGLPFLPCAIRNPVYQEAISQPGLGTVVLTTYDSVTVGDFGWSSDFVNETFVNEHADAIVAEYRDLTLALYETQAGSGKRFIITQWEGDNHIYCGSAYTYTVDAGFREKCSNVADTLAGMRRWFMLRQQGIRAGRDLAAARNLAGVYVADGIEFNSFHMLDGFGPSVLNDIIPYVRPEWASYSSWETIGRLLPGGAGETAMATDLTELKGNLVEHAPGTQLLIGEAGFEGSDGDLFDAAKQQQATSTDQALRVFNAANIPIVILWSSHDSTPVFDPARGSFTSIYHDGLYNMDGSERSYLHAVRAALPQLPPQGNPFVAGAGNVNANHATSWVELYGSFPVRVIRDGATRPRSFAQTSPTPRYAFRPWTAMRAWGRSTLP